MKRREFIIGGAAAAWPVVSYGQQASKIRRIGVLNGFDNAISNSARVTPFKNELQALGWVEGRNIQIDYREAPNPAELKATTPRASHKPEDRSSQRHADGEHEPGGETGAAMGDVISFLRTQADSLDDTAKRCTDPVIVSELQYTVSSYGHRPTSWKANRKFLDGSCPRLAQMRTWRHSSAMSALPLKADIRRAGWDVRFVPRTDIFPFGSH